MKGFAERALFPTLVAIGVTFGIALVVDAHLAPQRMRARAEAKGLPTAELDIPQVGCTMCRAEMSRTLLDTDGVADLQTERGGMVVAYDPKRITPKGIVAVVTKLGYEASLRSD